MRDINRFVLVDHSKFREQADYVPVERLSGNVVGRFRGGIALNVAAAWRSVMLYSMDERALWHFGLTREDYLTQEVEQLKDAIEDLKEDNLRLENIIVTRDEWQWA